MLCETAFRVGTTGTTSQICPRVTVNRRDDNGMTMKKARTDASAIQRKDGRQRSPGSDTYRPVQLNLAVTTFLTNAEKALSGDFLWLAL